MASFSSFLNYVNNDKENETGCTCDFMDLQQLKAENEELKELLYKKCAGVVYYEYYDNKQKLEKIEEIKDLLKHFDFFIDLAKGHETNG